jgi:hypothetical protein
MRTLLGFKTVDFILRGGNIVEKELSVMSLKRPFPDRGLFIWEEHV